MCFKICFSVTSLPPPPVKIFSGTTVKASQSIIQVEIDLTNGPSIPGCHLDTRAA